MPSFRKAKERESFKSSHVEKDWKLLESPLIHMFRSAAYRASTLKDADCQIPTGHRR